MNTELLVEHRQAVKDLIYKRRSCFTTSDDDLGSSNLVQHEINEGNNQPVRQAPYPSAWKQREIIETQVKKIGKADVIESSQSPKQLQSFYYPNMADHGVFASITVD